jgi:hypothetical protein
VLGNRRAKDYLWIAARIGRAAGVLAMFAILSAPLVRSGLLLALGLAAATPAAPVLSQTTPPVIAAAPDAADLSRTMRFAEIMDVMRQEGLDYGASLEEELFPGRGGAGWQVAVGLIYDTGTMNRRFDAALAEALLGDEATLTAAMAFFGDARGQRILTLEIEARRALLDEATEEAAQAHAEDMAGRDDPRLGLLKRFADANDLIESNVQGALNANLAFYRGLAEAGAMGAEMTEDEMLADVWGQEPDIRTETENWLFPYLALAYGPLEDADLEAYIDFSLSPEGRRLNVALFAAFDAVFGQISHDLGRASGRQMLGQDI